MKPTGEVQAAFRRGVSRLKEVKMKCPLFVINDPRARSGEETELGDCLEKACAWWDATAEKCAILQLTFELDELHCCLEKLVDKMPHAGQFLK